MTPPAAVTLCVINYDGAGHLREAFQALRGQDWTFAETILVDNASRDASLEVVRALCPEARIVRLPENRGPGAARNAGFREAANDLILFQDNDVRLCPDSTRLLVGHLQRRPASLLVAPRVLYSADVDTVQYDSADCHFLGLMSPRNANRKASELDDAACETTSMISACFLLDRRNWRGEAPFDESFGFNLEDHDFGVRARVTGHSLWVEPRATVLHGSGTPQLSYRPGDVPAERRLYYLTLNRWIVIGKCFAPRTVAVLLPPLVLYELMLLGWFLANGRPGTWWRAVRSFRRGWRRMRAERRLVQSRRCMRDRDVLRGGPLPLTAAIRTGGAAGRLIGMADYLVQRYWRLARRWL